MSLNLNAYAHKFGIGPDVTAVCLIMGCLAPMPGSLASVLEQETSGSAGLLSAIVNSSSDAIISRTLDGTVTSWNPAAAVLFGYCPEEAVGETIRRLIPVDRRDEDDRILARIKAGDRVSPYTTVRLDKTGRSINVALTVTPICDTQGNVIGVLDSAHNITSQESPKNSLEYEEILRAYIDYASIIVIILDRNMNNIACSRRFIEDFKLEGIPIIGRSHYEVLPEIPERWKEVHRRGLAGEVVRSDEDIFMRADGRAQWFRWEVRPWLKSDQTIGGITIMGEDVTDKVEAAKALRASQDRLQRFVENAPAAICMMDCDMVHLACSRRWLEGVGLPEAEIIGRNHYEVLPNLPESWKEAHRRALAGEVVSEEEDACGKLPDGAVRWARWEVRPWFTVDQTIGGITVMFEDVTERVETQRALRESENRLRFALEAGEVGTWETSVESGVIQASDRAYALIDVSPSTPMTYDVLVSRVHPDDCARVDEAFRRTFETGQSFQTEWRLLLPDGSVRWLETRGERRFLDGKQVVGGLVQDITVRIRQKEAVEKASKAKSEFLSNMSHELRTPMHAILGYSEICLQLANDGSTGEFPSYLQNIRTSGKRLLALLNDLLDLAKMEAGKMQYKREPAHMKEAVKHALMELDPLIKGKDIKLRLSLEEDAEAVFDKRHMIQVLINLISNAIKFSAPGGEIAIELSEDHAAEGAPGVCCRVIDEGPGIPETELEAVFDKFIQSSKTKTGAGGTGLGLAICQSIVAAHGGRIGAENRKPKGAIFTFAIPRNYDPEASGAKAA
jgi:PAS domain S-box-containing protein